MGAREGRRWRRYKKTEREWSRVSETERVGEARGGGSEHVDRKRAKLCGRPAGARETARTAGARAGEGGRRGEPRPGEGPRSRELRAPRRRLCSAAATPVPRLGYGHVSSPVRLCVCARARGSPIQPRLGQLQQRRRRRRGEEKRGSRPGRGDRLVQETEEGTYGTRCAGARRRVWCARPPRECAASMSLRTVDAGAPAQDEQSELGRELSRELVT